MSGPGSRAAIGFSQTAQRLSYGYAQSTLRIWQAEFSNRAESALNNYWPIKEECTTTEGERVVLSLSGAQAKELIGAVSMSEVLRSGVEKKSPASR